MIDTIIVSGGNIMEDFALDFLNKEIDRAGRNRIYLIAADKGLDFFRKTAGPEGILPDAAVGDFDSLSPEGIRFLEETPGMEIIRLKPEKDDLDTQSATMFAIGRGAGEIAILGATGTRVDHVMANLGLLFLGEDHGARIRLVDAWNTIMPVKSGTALKKTEQTGNFVSFFPMGGDVEGLTLKGFRYPLNGHRLTLTDSGLTVSNEITEDTAEITFDSGRLLMIMSGD